MEAFAGLIYYKERDSQHWVLCCYKKKCVTNITHTHKERGVEGEIKEKGERSAIMS